MRYAIIGDIHANLAAFEAVLKDIEEQGEVGKIWCLGDVVGYGPNPNECVELLRDLKVECIVGNHDWAVMNKVDVQDFNPDAQRSVIWTQMQLKPEIQEYPLEAANQAIVELKAGKIRGAKVLKLE